MFALLDGVNRTPSSLHSVISAALVLSAILAIGAGCQGQTYDGTCGSWGFTLCHRGSCSGPIINEHSCTPCGVEEVDDVLCRNPDAGPDAPPDGPDAGKQDDAATESGSDSAAQDAATE